MKRKRYFDTILLSENFHVLLCYIYVQDQGSLRFAYGHFLVLLGDVYICLLLFALFENTSQFLLDAVSHGLLVG